MSTRFEAYLGSATGYWREAALVLVCVVMLAGFLLQAPMAQSLAYHKFADGRELAGVPNLLDVASNVPFLLIGVAGVLFCLRRRLALSWLVLFAATSLVCLGSGYYHLTPRNDTLLWDRLPMTVAFMALFVGLISEHMGARVERYLLAPAVATGLASALWWHFTDDLRFYFWVQYTPLVCIPFVLALFPGRHTHRGYLFYALGLYVLAKLTEAWDREIFALTANLVSGHTLKHVLAAGAVLSLLAMLQARKERMP
jgi:ceramidase